MNNCWRLVDLPGYGFAQGARKHSARFNKAVAEYLEHRTNLCLVFALIESGLAAATNRSRIRGMARGPRRAVRPRLHQDGQDISRHGADEHRRLYEPHCAMVRKVASDVHLFRRDWARPPGIARRNQRADDRNQRRVEPGTDRYRKPKPANARSKKPKTASRPQPPLVRPWFFVAPDEVSKTDSYRPLSTNRAISAGRLVD